MTPPEHPIKRIGLGTVQFGLDYGISNRRGRVPLDEAAQILGRAATLGIKVLDTAALYGASEETLGSILGPEHPFHIITKTDKFDCEHITNNHVDELKRSFERSLQRLRQSMVHGLLVHDVDDLLKPGARRIVDLLGKLKSERRVNLIGVSVYTSEQIDAVLELFTPDLIQLPVNVFDQRLLSSGQLDRLQRLGVTVHARSVFLQGLLLMEPQILDDYFDPVRDRLEAYRTDLSRCGASPLEGALQFALSQPQIDTVLVGVCSRRELEDVRLATMRRGFPDFDFDRWAVNDPRYVNPALWRLHEGRLIQPR